MLEFYIESGRRLRQLRQSPAGEHLDGFADWLHLAGCKQRPGQLTLRAAAHLGHWAWTCGIPTERFDGEVVSNFARHLPGVCPKQQRPRAGDTGPAGQGRSARRDGG